MCGYPIDQTLHRSRHPLGSVVDEWFPRSLGGDPLDPVNTVEMHRCCNTSKHNHWPVTEEMRTRCRTLVETHLGTPTIHPW